jgi:hypothetical protein
MICCRSGSSSTVPSANTVPLGVSDPCTRVSC